MAGKAKSRKLNCRHYVQDACYSSSIPAGALVLDPAQHPILDLHIVLQESSDEKHRFSVQNDSVVQVRYLGGGGGLTRHEDLLQELVRLGEEARVGKASQSRVMPHGEEGFMYALGHRAKEDGTLVEYKSNTICENTLPMAIAVADKLTEEPQQRLHSSLLPVHSAKLLLTST